MVVVAVIKRRGLGSCGRETSECSANCKSPQYLMTGGSRDARRTKIKKPDNAIVPSIDAKYPLVSTESYSLEALSKDYKSSKLEDIGRQVALSF